MSKDRDVLLKAVQTQFDILNDTILEDVWYDNLRNGLSSLNDESERIKFVNDLRSDLSKKLDELILLTELKTKLENKLPVEVY